MQEELLRFPILIRAQQLLSILAMKIWANTQLVAAIPSLKKKTESIVFEESRFPKNPPELLSETKSGQLGRC
jgi:hypothetical protein